MILLYVHLMFWLAAPPVCLGPVCRCLPVLPPLEAAAQSAVVFVGEVVRVDTTQWTTEGALGSDTVRHLITGPTQVARLRVLQSIKGVSEQELSILAGPGMCAFSFAVGQRYLVYAYRYLDALRASRCSRTRLLAQAGEDLTILSPSR